MMTIKITVPVFIVSVLCTSLVLLGASVTLPHDRYHRFQTHDNVTTRKSDWVYERLHFDPTPIDIALIGTSRTAGGISGPLVEREYCRLTQRKIHIANLAIPSTGRNMHYVLAREAIRQKNPQLILLELNEIESRRLHPGFIFLADARDVISAPVFINTNFLSDLIRLPGRQIELFIRDVFGNAPIRSTFDQSRYSGAHHDLTATLISIDGREQSRDLYRSAQEMDRLYEERKAAQQRTYLLPAYLHQLEYRLPRYYVNKIRAAAAKAHSNVAFVHVPAYRAPDLPPYVTKELQITEPILNLASDAALDPNNWIDATHFNQHGATKASMELARQLSKTYPSLGTEMSCD